MTGSLSNRIIEFHRGATYARTKAKSGKAKADKQAVAAGYTSIGEIHKQMAKRK